MPTIFNYAAEVPPAPYALVTLAQLDGSVSVVDLPAKVDSGAAQTVAIFRLLLTIRGCPTVELNVAASDGEPYILLGRDVLNQFRVVLDGPNGKLEIG